MVRDIHQQVQAAMALLEDKIERLSCSFSCGWGTTGAWAATDADQGLGAV